MRQRGMPENPCGEPGIAYEHALASVVVAAGGRDEHVDVEHRLARARPVVAMKEVMPVGAADFCRQHFLRRYVEPRPDLDQLRAGREKPRHRAAVPVVASHEDSAGARDNDVAAIRHIASRT